MSMLAELHPNTCTQARGFTDVVSALLDKGVEPNGTSPDGYSPLAVACM